MKVRVENRYDLESEVKVYSTEAPDEIARFAMDLIEKHAMVAGADDGEDSSGRQRTRLQTPEELVERSFSIAELTFAIARRRGYMVALPDLNELNAEYDATREAQRQEKKEREAARAAAKVA